MTLNVTVPDAMYRQIADLATRQQVSVERIVAAALAEQLPAGRAWSKWPNAAAANASWLRWTRFRQPNPPRKTGCSELGSLMREVAVERGIIHPLNTREAGFTKSLLDIPSRFAATDC
jgi:hypothetical protein